MIPWKKNIVVRRGNTKEVYFRVRERVWNPTTEEYEPGAYRDLTGWTVESQIRDEIDSVGEPAAEFTCTVLAQAGDTLGGVYCKLTPIQTRAITAFTEGFWDVELTTPSGDVFTYIEGKVKITGEVTRD